MNVPDTEHVGVHFVVSLTHPSNPHRVAIAYQIRAKGTECIVYRAVLQGLPPKANDLKLIEHWQAISWHQGLASPDATAVAKDFDFSNRSFSRKAQRHESRVMLGVR